MDYRIREAIELIDKQIQRLTDAKKVLELIDSGEIITPRIPKPAAGKRRKRYNLSEEARARIAAGQKKRWDAFHANGGTARQQKAVQ